MTSCAFDMADLPSLHRCQLCRETAANYVLESDTVPAATVSPTTEHAGGLLDDTAHRRKPGPDYVMRHDQTCACPPSTKNSIPLTKLASSEAKNTAAEAISAGSAIRPSGTEDAKLARTSSGLPGMKRNRPGVLVGPGLSALTRMPRPPSS